MKNGYTRIMLMLFFGIHIQQIQGAEFNYSSSPDQYHDSLHTLKQACHSCFNAVKAIATKIHDHFCTIPSHDAQNGGDIAADHEEGLTHIPLNPEDEKNEAYKQESILNATC